MVLTEVGPQNLYDLQRIILEADNQRTKYTQQEEEILSNFFNN